MASFEYGYFIKVLHILVQFLQLTFGFGFQNYKDPTQHKNWPLLNFGTSCGHSISAHYGYKVPSFDLDTRIWGGEIAGKNEFPWVVYLQITAIFRSLEKDTYSCGGSVINDRYVLTAAHCCYIPLTIKTNYDVVLINDNLDINDYVIKDVEKVIIHEKYDYDKSRNDICLVRLRKPLKFSASIQPICLPVEPEWKYTDLAGRMMTVAGWGNINDDTGEKPDFLRKVILPVVPITDCIKQRKVAGLNKKKPVNSKTQFCAGNRRKDACSGDSGGPVMYQYKNNKGVSRYFLIGLVSFGNLCQNKKTDLPSVFVKVSHYIPWILDNIYE